MLDFGEDELGSVGCESQVAILRPQSRNQLPPPVDVSDSSRSSRAANPYPMCEEDSPRVPPELIVSNAYKLSQLERRGGFQLERERIPSNQFKLS